MKKILALVLALMLVLSTSMVAFADSYDAAGTATGDVNIKITATDEDDNETPIENPDDVDPEDATYKVDIDLENYTFTYNFGTYNTSTHEYSNGKGWDGHTSESFKVINHSNTGLDVTAKFEGQKSKEDKGVTATIDNDVFKLASAVGSGVNPPEKDVTVTVSGAPTTTSGWKISTVTLTFAGTAK